MFEGIGSFEIVVVALILGMSWMVRDMHRERRLDAERLWIYLRYIEMRIRQVDPKIANEENLRILHEMETDLLCVGLDEESAEKRREKRLEEWMFTFGKHSDETD